MCSCVVCVFFQSLFFIFFHGGQLDERVLLLAACHLLNVLNYYCVECICGRGLRVYPYPRVYPTRPVYPRVRVGSGTCSTGTGGSGRCLTGTGLPVFTRKKIIKCALQLCKSLSKCDTLDLTAC